MFSPIMQQAHVLHLQPQPHAGLHYLLPPGGAVWDLDLQHSVLMLNGDNFQAFLHYPLPGDGNSETIFPIYSHNQIAHAHHRIYTFRNFTICNETNYRCIFYHHFNKLYKIIIACYIAGSTIIYATGRIVVDGQGRITGGGGKE